MSEPTGDLQLGKTNIAGSIPTTIGNLSVLNILDLRSLDSLTGTIPTELARLSRLGEFWNALATCSRLTPGCGMNLTPTLLILRILIFASFFTSIRRDSGWGLQSFFSSAYHVHPVQCILWDTSLWLICEDCSLEFHPHPMPTFHDTEEKGWRCLGPTTNADCSTIYTFFA